MAHIGIVGGGIIGCATAIHLIARGHAVTVFEKEIDGLPASVGNACILAIPEIDPLARPDMILAAPKWLVDPLGPLTLRWQDAPSLTPWLLRLLMSATPAKIARSRQALLSLMRDARADHFAMADMAGISGHIVPTGAMTVFDSAAKCDAYFRHERETGGLLGFSVEKLDEKAARKRVPALEGPFAGAVVNDGYQTFPKPLFLLRNLQEQIRHRGTLVTKAAKAVTQQADGIVVVTDDGERHLVDKVAITSGIWSREFVRALGLKVLLETERGYNTNFRDPSVTLELPVFFSEHGFVATPLENALRIGGAVELAHPDAPANFARASAMRQKMRRYVPALPETGGVEWMGRRPSTPDSIPVISLHPRDPRIAFGFGHGHLGVTLSATTGKLVGNLLLSGPDAALDPFSISRFQ